jgi:urease accessory protein
MSAEVTCPNYGDAALPARSFNRRINRSITMVIRRMTLATALATLPTAAFAHCRRRPTTGLLHSFGPPISGVDHILAMLMVGVLAWRLGGQALWLMPITFPR